jgi:hypothetical protein
MTLITSGPVVTQLMKAIGLSFNQLLCHTLWCRHRSARVPGRLGFMRRHLSFVLYSNHLYTFWIRNTSGCFLEISAISFKCTGIVSLVRGMESSGKFCQDIKNIMKDAYLKAYIHQQQLQFQHNWPVLELGTFLSYPNFKIKPILVTIICVTVMVIDSILQDVLCSTRWAFFMCVTWNVHRKTQLFQVWWYSWSTVTTGVCPEIRCQQHS